MEHFAYYRADANQARKSPVNKWWCLLGGVITALIFSSAKTLVIMANLTFR
jgi:hypothetical protein